jgi:hypothetical protein
MAYLTQPGQSYIRAAGSLGWGFPAAMGAKCGAPDRPVICFIGDGGFYYHLSELETASNGCKRESPGSLDPVREITSTRLLPTQTFPGLAQKRGQGKEMLPGMIVGQTIIPVTYFGCYIIRPNKCLDKSPEFGNMHYQLMARVNRGSWLI